MPQPIHLFRPQPGIGDTVEPEPSKAIRELILEGKLDEAEQLAYEGLKQAPDYPPLWMALGDIEEIRGQKDSASRLREAAIQSLQGLADKGCSSLTSDALEGWVLWKEDRLEEAIEPLQRCAMALKGGDDAFVQLLLGSAYLVKERYLEARTALERAHAGTLRPGLRDYAMEGLKVLGHGLEGHLQGMDRLAGAYLKSRGQH